MADPDHVAVTTRYLRATRVPAADGAPDLVDPVAADPRRWPGRCATCVAHLGGRTPSTWSRTVHLGPDRRPAGGRHVVAAPRVRMLLGRGCPAVGHDGGMTSVTAPVEVTAA